MLFSGVLALPFAASLGLNFELLQSSWERPADLKRIGRLSHRADNII